MYQVESALLLSLIGWEVSDVDQDGVACEDQTDDGCPEEEGEWP